jgi:N utilization substance protein B
VELGKNFGKEESCAFVNGLLDRVAVALGKT